MHLEGQAHLVPWKHVHPSSMVPGYVSVHLVRVEGVDEGTKLAMRLLTAEGSHGSEGLSAGLNTA